MGPGPDAMTIGELPGRAGVTSKTVRYYEQLGLPPRARRSRRDVLGLMQQLGAAPAP